MTEYERQYSDRLSRERAELAEQWNRARMWAIAWAVVAATGWGGVAIIAASLWWPR